MVCGCGTFGPGCVRCVSLRVPERTYICTYGTLVLQRFEVPRQFCIGNFNKFTSTLIFALPDRDLCPRSTFLPFKGYARAFSFALLLLLDGV